MENCLPWFVLQLRPQREEAVSRALLLKGYEVFLPMRRERCPLFTGYLFCRLNPDLPAKIVTTPGVIRILGFGRKPIAVPEQEVATIQQIVSSNLTRQPWRYLPHGTLIRIETGPLKGVEG